VSDAGDSIDERAGESPTRRRVLDAITRLFVEKGFHATGVNDMTIAAGLGKGALYYHIGSKEQVLFDISMELTDGVLRATRSVIETPGTPEEHSRGLARALLRDHAANGEGWIVAVREARFLSPQHQQQLNAARDEIEQIWRDVFRRGADAGSWRKLDSIEVRGVLGMINSARRWMDPRGPLSPDEIADRYIALVLHGIGRDC